MPTGWDRNNLVNLQENKIDIQKGTKWLLKYSVA